MKLTLPNDIEQIPKLSEFIDSICETFCIDMETTMSLNLALEEAVVNVMSYAYPEGTKGDVDIEVVKGPQYLDFIISDSGKPFNPTTKEDPDTNLSVEERPIGGLGIHIIRQIMDSVHYERKENRNYLTLRKKFIN